MTNGREPVVAPWEELKTRLAERGVKILKYDATTFRKVASYLGVDVARCTCAFVWLDAWTLEFIERVAAATGTPPDYWTTLCDKYARSFRQSKTRGDIKVWERQYREYCDAQ